MKKQLFVTLVKSDNKYLSYPCSGMLELFETGTDGSVIVGVFKAKTGAPVTVKNPEFHYPSNERWQP